MFDKILFANSRSLSCIANAFRRSKIIPDVITKGPNKLLEVTYDIASFRPGKRFAPTEVAGIPVFVKWRSADCNAMHTVCMVDPDVTSRHNSLGQWLHWLVVNIPGHEICQGDTIAQYLGAAPAKDTGCHRYVFLAFQQNDEIDIKKLTFLNNKTARGRPNFSVNKFRCQHGLSEAIAGNYFISEYDKSVDAFYCRLAAGEKALIAQEGKDKYKESELPFNVKLRK